ncbi:hypothetical protein [Salinigranum marinum]|uniref:hypothetical protein n=1 Tax=Salinigranum marinum TaxID=1515595 RepID=UPI002989AD22|nr:hypothetical protein [Salinigranum marinum]
MAPQGPTMHSQRHELLQSIRRWLRAVAFLLGLGLVVLANVGHVVSDYRGGLVFLLGGVAGGTVALVAGTTLFGDLAVSGGGGPTDDAAD